MRHMSFSQTTPQFLDDTKDITRRLGWYFLKAGDLVMAVEKGQGLKKGEKVKKLGVIEIISARSERLDVITPADVIREGYPDRTPEQFIESFCKFANCKPDQIVNRIEFKRLHLEFALMAGQAAMRDIADLKLETIRLKTRESELIRLVNGKEATEADKHLVAMVDRFGPISTAISQAAYRAEARLERDKKHERETEVPA